MQFFYIIYIDAHPRCRVVIFFKSLRYLYEVVYKIFSASFGTFRNFRLQFGENCDGNWNRKWKLFIVSERAIELLDRFGKVLGAVIRQTILH